jgi:hypothetical protein
MVDTFISTQLPNTGDDPIGYEAVSSFMIHGPEVTYSSYLVDGKYSKFYLKNYENTPLSLKVYLLGMLDLTMD